MDALDPDTFAPEPNAAGAETSTPRDEIPPDPQPLIDQMVAAGRWPRPSLLQQILYAGEAAVEPLVAVVTAVHHQETDPAPIANAIGLLSVLRPAAAIPVLVSFLMQCPGDLAPDAAYALSSFGVPGFDTLLDLCLDSSLSALVRCDLYGAARVAAADDPVLRSRLTEVLRTILGDLIPRARQEREQNPVEPEDDEEVDERSVLFNEFDDDEAGSEDESFDEEDGLEDESFDEESIEDDGSFDDDDVDDLDDELVDDDSEPGVDDDEMSGESEDGDSDEPRFTINEEIGFLVADLACLADPLSVELIETAFREKLVDREIVSKAFVDKKYRAGGEPVGSGPDFDWLSEYRLEYESHVENLNRPRHPRPVTRSSHDWDEDDRDEEADTPIVTSPIRKTGPKVGRNDPCWCGSGKKYKKCHLGKDVTE